MKGAALFFVDALVKDPKTGFLYHRAEQLARAGRAGDGSDDGPADRAQPLRRDDRGGQDRWTSMPTCATSSPACGSRSRRNQIGKHGQLQEWMEDKDDPKNQHRHVSHLWGVYPG